MYEVRAGAQKFNTSVPEQAVIFTDFFFVCTNLVRTWYLYRVHWFARSVF